MKETSYKTSDNSSASRKWQLVNQNVYRFLSIKGDEEHRNNSIEKKNNCQATIFFYSRNRTSYNCMGF
jgi:hypothetical protein